MREFTFTIFEKLLEQFQLTGYKILPVKDYPAEHLSKVLFLRHDVDRYPAQTIKMARLEAKMNINATYYFRTIPTVFKNDVLTEVSTLGHEIGYHYEDLTATRGDLSKAFIHFKNNLERVRKFYPVETICMHGSPASPWDNKKLWENYDYRQLGLKLDTSLDVDYDSVFYITDNGFGWNKVRTSVRDKVISRYRIPIKNTSHLINLLKGNSLPDRIMLNAHPDTFFDPGLMWHLNFASIKSKNIIKWIIVKSGIYK